MGNLLQICETNVGKVSKYLGSLFDEAAAVIAAARRKTGWAEERDRRSGQSVCLSFSRLVGGCFCSAVCPEGRLSERGGSGRLDSPADRR